VRNEHLARYAFAAGHVGNRRVLDCACGDGTGASVYRRGGAAQVLAVDIALGALARASRAKAGVGVSFAAGDAERMPVANRAVDVVVALEMIEHLRDERRFLGEVVRVLRPGGSLVCSTPNRTVYSPGRKLLSRPWNPFHVREWSAEEFHALLSGFFAEIEMFGQNPQSAWRSALMTVIGRRLSPDLATFLARGLKVPRFLHDSVHRRRVRSGRGETRSFEYLVAVCRRPSWS